MRVLVTGGTGFVGSHTIAALVKQDDQVRLLVRSPNRVEPALGPHGSPACEVVVGDVTDREAVAAAVAGCDAVIHAANVFSFDPRQAHVMSAVNEQGTDIVLTEAARADLDPIVHVSSFVALLPSDGPLTAESEVGAPAPTYGKSKAVAERIARRLQADGLPVVITYPGSVWGPHDPYLGESDRQAQNALRGRVRLLNRGSLPISDVRDVAAIHAAVMRPGLGPRRYIAVEHNPNFRSTIARLGELAGRNLWSIPVPAPIALATGRVADWMRLRLGVDPNLSYEAPWLLANAAEVDSTGVINELGIDFTPLDTTLADTTRWLCEAGHITSRQAGTLSRSVA